MHILFFLDLTVLDDATVLLTLGLAVELVSVGLTKAGFVLNTQTGREVKGPDGWLTSAGLRYHGQTTHGWTHTEQKKRKPSTI